MLSFIGIDINDNEINLSAPEYVTINQEEDVPADDISVVFPFIPNLPELQKVTVKNNSRVVFIGLVDEQQIISKEQGIWTKIVGRSPAALLLDNESKPISYLNSSSSVIADKHLKPYGMENFTGEDIVLAGTLNIPKGYTQWQALYNFCISAYGNRPRVDAVGTVKMKGIESDESILFSNKTGYKYISIKENNKRHKLLSSVKVKIGDEGDYNSVVENKVAVDRKINRVRYLDSTNSSELFSVADKMLEKSVKDSYEIVLVCSDILINLLGVNAKIQDEYIGEKDNLYISGICYRLSPEGEYTTVTLKKKGE